MKLFYKYNSITWHDLYKQFEGADCVAYEFVAPYSWGDEEKTTCPNAICLWDEEKYGGYYRESVFMGECSYGEALYTYDKRDYLYKIDEAIGDEKEVVLAMSEDLFSQQLLDYFIKLRDEKGFRLHVLMNIKVAIRSADERILLPCIQGIDAIDSVTFFNHGDLRDIRNDYTWDAEEWRKEILACEEILAEQAAQICIRLADLSPSGNEELWLYRTKNDVFERIQIQEKDVRKGDSKFELPFEIISPNEGKETCRKLKGYREDFKYKHGLKKKENPCTYMGECKGTCKQCEEYAAELWVRAYSGKLKRFYGEGIAGINGMIRLRENIDGPGIRTLVVMNDCHLHCKYCINEQYLNQLPLSKPMFASDIGHYIEKDAVYYEMTGGGVTFGGGEPLLHSDFIKNFRGENPNISIAVETSLNVPFEAVEKLILVVEHWIIDIKDMNDDIYIAYTGQSNGLVKTNLKYLLNHVAPEKILCRVPLIEGYNTEEDTKRSVDELKEMGVQNTECFRYKVNCKDAEA